MTNLNQHWLGCSPLKTKLLFKKLFRDMLHERPFPTRLVSEYESMCSLSLSFFFCCQLWYFKHNPKVTYAVILKRLIMLLKIFGRKYNEQKGNWTANILIKDCKSRWTAPWKSPPVRGSGLPLTVQWAVSGAGFWIWTFPPYLWDGVMAPQEWAQGRSEPSLLTSAGIS